MTTSDKSLIGSHTDQGNDSLVDRTGASSFRAAFQGYLNRGLEADGAPGVGTGQGDTSLSTKSGYGDAPEQTSGAGKGIAGELPGVFRASGDAGDGAGKAVG